VSVLSNEVGGGHIRDDVRGAIEHELCRRLQEPSPGGALTVADRNLILLAINGVTLKASLCELYARAAIRSGASTGQVLDAALSVILIGMIRWKMAGMGAFLAAVDVAGDPQSPAPAEQSGAGNESLPQMREYVSNVLGRDFPDMWETLARYAPGVLEGYMKLRGNILRANPVQGSLDKKMVELIVVACDIVQGNSWGAEMHVRQAVRDGITPSQVVEAVALAMIEGGVPVYQTGGRDVIAAAEDEARKHAAR
jgi:AhpD family alkylhydroperoxidase